MNALQIITAVIFAIAAIIYIVWKIKKEGWRKVAIAAIVKAEESFQNGETKLEMAVGTFIAALGFPLNKIPAKLVTKFIQTVFDEIKDAENAALMRERSAAYKKAFNEVAWDGKW